MSREVGGSGETLSCDSSATCLGARRFLGGGVSSSDSSGVGGLRDFGFCFATDFGVASTLGLFTEPLGLPRFLGGSRVSTSSPPLASPGTFSGASVMGTSSIEAIFLYIILILFDSYENNGK